MLSLYVDYGGRYDSLNGEDIRTEMGLEWMLRPEKKTERKVEEPDEHWQKEPIADEVVPLFIANTSLWDGIH